MAPPTTTTTTGPYSQLRPAPWKHPSELAMVRDWFYPNPVGVRRPFYDFACSAPPDHDRRQDAIHLVALWQFKYPQLTKALVSTAHLTDAILHDQPGRREKLSCLALRSLYAMSFCRFVNALVDRDVRKSVTATIARDADVAGRVAVGAVLAAGMEREGEGEARPATRVPSSMYAHAAELGLPESFVELRHQAIHGEMPSLAVLRARTEEALDWLWQKWWKVNVQGGSDPALGEWEARRRGMEDATTFSVQRGIGDGAVDEAGGIGRTGRMRKREGGCSDDDNGDEDDDEEKKKKKKKNDAEREDSEVICPKQPERAAEQKDQDNAASLPAPWTMHFTGAIPQAGKISETPSSLT